MAIQYQIAAFILYAEVAVVLLLSLPFISNRVWGKIFKWKIFNVLSVLGEKAFLIGASLLGVLFFDSINSMTKYERLAEEQEEKGNLVIGHDPHSSKFRAQRNFYITMFAFVFWIVLRRLIAVIAIAAMNEIKAEALERQAKSAGKMAEQLMSEKDDAKGDDGEEAKKLKAEIKRLNVRLSEATCAQEKAEEDLQVVKDQAAANNREYDRLMAELEKAQAAGGDKKDE